MRRFAFRLETVLGLRKRREDEIKRELAVANARLLDARGRLSTLENRFHRFQMEEKERRTKSLNLQSLRASVVYRHQLRQEIHAVIVEIEQLRLHAGEVTRRLTKAMQARRVVELLRERRYAEWRKDTSQQQQAIIDDASQRRYNRRQKAGTRVGMSL